VTAHWEEPEDANGIVTSYNVTVEEIIRGQLLDDRSEYSYVECEESPCVINGLKDCTNYQLQVTAINGVGSGTGSDLVETTTLAGGKKKPINIHLKIGTRRTPR